jgi:hypothetical protein
MELLQALAYCPRKGNAPDEGSKRGMLWVDRVGNIRSQAILERNFLSKRGDRHKNEETGKKERFRGGRTEVCTNTRRRGMNSEGVAFLYIAGWGKGLKRRPLAPNPHPRLADMSLATYCSVTFLNEATRRGVLIVAHHRKRCC